MKRRNALGVLGFACYVLIACALAASFALFMCSEVSALRQSGADKVLAYFQQTMILKLHGDVGRTGDLVAAFESDPDDEAWFPQAAASLLERDEVAYVAFVRGDAMAYAYPEAAFGDTVGLGLTEFPYIYTLAKVTDDFVVEGPVELSNGESVFLFIEPVDVDGAFFGEMVVGIKEGYVIEQLDFSSLQEDGYVYELWAVSPQDGSKDVIAASEGGYDFSHAAKTTFNMPTQWTLSIMPEQGWVPRSWIAFIVCSVAAVALLTIALGGVLVSLHRSRRMRLETARRDADTGLLTYAALVDLLRGNASRRKGPEPLTIVCLMVDGFSETALSLDWDARRSYLENVRVEIDRVILGRHDAARMGAGCFVVVLYELVERRELGDLMRALELALLWKVRVDGKKAFCMARSAAVRFPEDGDDPVALVERTVSLLERDRPNR